MVEQGGAWAGCGPAQSLPRCTKCNSPPINGQRTNFILFDVARYKVPIKGLTTSYRIASCFAIVRCQGQLFDVVFSFSSLEHSGLGRYGDPLAPYGDAEAVAQLWCAVRPGGLFFLGLPSFSDDDQRRRMCRVFWNSHRVYGYVRLQHVTANWQVLDEIDMRDGIPHFIYVLRKLPWGVV